MQEEPVAMVASAPCEISASARFMDRQGRTVQVIDLDGDEVLYAIRGVASFRPLRANLEAFRGMVGLERRQQLHLAWSRDLSARPLVPQRQARLS
jgi:hypothetical protein